MSEDAPTVEHAAKGDARRGQRGPWLAVGRWTALVAIGVAMARLTWRAWPDPLIDFGREAYVAWRIAEGDVLYRDVAYFNGPLSPHVNALALRLSGTGLFALWALNLVLIGVATALLDTLLRAVAGTWSAFVGCVLFLSVFAFGQYTAAGSYNWVAPYSHELTHGLLLALAALVALRNATPRGSLQAGILAGLAFLTKAEVFAALAVAIAFALLARPRGERHVQRLVVGSCVPPLLAFVALVPALGVAGAFGGTVGSWAHVFGSGIAQSPFYRAMAGLDAPGENLLSIALGVAAYAALVAIAWGTARLRGHRTLVCSGIFLLVGGGLWLARDAVPWLRAVRSWPLLVGLALLLTLRSRRTRDLRPALAVFALVLLGKILLATRVQLYGFALALPATMVLVAAAVDWLPDALERRGGSGAAFRAAILGALSVAAGMHVAFTAERVQSKTVRVGRGSDAFYSDVRGRFVKRTLRSLDELEPGASVVVLPEGAMLNYLSRRANPTPYPNFMPPELLFFGEERILEALRAQPPDAVVLVHKDTSEYGPRFFGRDYGAPIMEWVRGTYSGAALFGATPLTGEHFGIALLVRQ